MARRKFSWTPGNLEKLRQVQIILEQLHQYKPLTLRQVFYQLVGKGIIPNTVSQYTMLSGLLKHARLTGRIHWDDIEDRVRTFHNLTGYDDQSSFLDTELDNFLEGYRLDLMQDQDIYLEIWIEKDALSSIFTREAIKYSIPVVVCRGFSSVSFLNDYATRARYYSGLNRTPVISYWGDFDPSGIEMFNAMQTTLKDEFNISNIRYIRSGLLLDDIKKYNLPADPDALKLSDTRAKAHLEKYGSLAVELDALSPPDLVNKINNEINKLIDRDRYNLKLMSEREHIKQLTQIKEKVQDYIINL